MSDQKPCNLYLRIKLLFKTKNKTKQGFPGGAVVKNPPANEGDTGSIPGLGGSHLLRSNKARVPQLLSLD